MAQSTPDRARAEAQFKAREARKADAPKATQDYQAEQNAVLARTKRLREERLMREAAASSADEIGELKPRK